MPSATMPRTGTPGTVTAEQLQQLQALNFEPARHWSREEAQLILDAVAYLREVIREVRGQGEAPVDLQNRLLLLILGDAELREAVKAWSADPYSTLRRDAHFDRVASLID
jgi:hypothetical protein